MAVFLAYGHTCTCSWYGEEGPSGPGKTAPYMPPYSIGEEPVKSDRKTHESMNELF
jgi:hypothetical protein